MIDNEKILEIVRYGMSVTLPDSSIISRDRHQHKFILTTSNNEVLEVDEKSLKKYFSKFKYWKTQDDEIYELNQMTTSHLENAIKHIDTLPGKLKKNGKSVNKIYKEQMKSILRERYINSLEIDDEDIGIDL